MLIVLLGPPGAGKGTQAKVLAKERSMLHIATGDILRAEVQAGSELGRKARTFMDRGDLVPDEVMIGIIQQRLSMSDASGSVILDGFPRTVVQAEALDRALSTLDRRVDKAVFLRVSEPELLKRIAGRGEGRADDRPEAAKRRLDVYVRQTAPVLDYYRSLGRLAEVNGEQTPERVTDDLLAQVG